MILALFAPNHAGNHAPPVNVAGFTGEGDVPPADAPTVAALPMMLLKMC
jgi:hypothetical protein